MKIKLIATVLSLIMIFSVFNSMLVSAEDGEFCENVKVSDINGNRSPVGVVVYTSEHGEKTGTTGQGLELTVDIAGKIISVAKNNSVIPKEGFVLSFGSVAANNLPKISEGDYAYFDNQYLFATVVSKDYNPFNEQVLNYDAINATRAENKLIIYRNRVETGTNTWGVEAVVDANGIIVSVGGNNNKIPEGGFVISGVGNKKQFILDSCVQGYSATLDETSKTVTISYAKENAFKSYELRINEFVAQEENAIMNFADIDYKKVRESVETLKLIFEQIKADLNQNDLLMFAAHGYRFEAETEILKSALVPYVPVETRTIWLRIPTNASLAKVESTVNDIYEMGFNSVCIEVLFDSTMIMPMPEDSLFEQNPVFKGEDMLKHYIDKFHALGIEVHAWVSCYRVGHDGSTNVSASVGKKKPEWLNIDQNGKDSVTNEYGNAYFLNPALPEVQEFLLETYHYILENYEIDGFQLDYVRYPENSTVNYGYDEYTVSLFKEKSGYEKEPTSSSQAGWKEWCEFRASFVTDLVKKTGELIKEIRPDVLFSCDVAPGYESTKTKMCQDTETWLKEGLVDVIYPMAYGTTDAVVKWTDNTVSLSGEGIQTVIGLRDNGCETYREQILAARECGADGTAFFSYSQYVSGNYKDYIKDSVFAKSAVCPSFNAKAAVIAQLEHIATTVNERICPVIESKNSSADKNTLIAFAEKLNAYTKSISEKKLSETMQDLEALFAEGKNIAENYTSESDVVSNNISEYLLKSIRVAEKAALNSVDDAKAAYKDSLTDNECEVSDSSDASDEMSNEDDETSETSSSTFEKVFQVLFIVIMTTGLLGLPAFYWLNSRKKRLLQEYNDENRDSDDSSNE